MKKYARELELSEISSRLADRLKTTHALRAFALSFYYIRVGFVRINFVIGARCPYSESYWRPMAQNLWEELGGATTTTHNQLYRNFLSSLKLTEPNHSSEPAFARRFNRSWDYIAKELDLLKSISCLAVYEAMDAPDYTMLYDVLNQVSGGALDLEFFEVHSGVDHFSMFTEFFESQKKNNIDRIREDAEERVIKLQFDMWDGLLRYLDETVYDAA